MPDTMQTVAEARETALARSVLYGFLSRALGHPSGLSVAALHEIYAPALAGLRCAAAPVNAAVRAARAALPRDVAATQATYVRLFTHVVSPDCPTFETAFGRRDVFQQAQTLADIAGFYRAHGTAWGGSERERPDHISVELEFMALLARKEVLARERNLEDAAEECARSQAHFLRDHLGCWAPGLGRRITRLAAADPFYAAAGRLLTAWVEADMAERAIQPAQVLDEPGPLAAEGEWSCETEDFCDSARGVSGAPALIRPDEIR